MKQAQNNPVSTGPKEFNTADIKPAQRASRDLDQYEGESEIVVAELGDREDSKEVYNAELQFMEEPVKIRIAKSSEKMAPNTVPCWVNGKGAEQFINGRWMQCGWLPVNHTVITRRKYIEVLARSKQESVSTRVVKHEQSEENIADRYTSTKYPFSVLEDTAKGHEWLANILQQH